MLIFTSLIDIAVDHQALLKQFEYLNHMNPHTFEVDDLDRLIKSVNSVVTSYVVMGSVQGTDFTVALCLDSVWRCCRVHAAALFV